MSRLTLMNLFIMKTVVIDISSIEPVLAGPKRPQDKVLLSEVHFKSAKDIRKNN